MPGTVELEKRDGLGWIVFDHEARRNAINDAMWNAIPKAVADLEADPEVRVVIMRGRGDVAFVSGADISEFERNRVGDAALEYDARNARAFEALAGLSKPLIAGVHGFCVGGGCAIALNADLRFAAEDAVFAIPAGRLGLGYSSGGLAALVAVVGLPAAKEIFLTARRFSAQEALAMGLVNRVLPKAELDAFVEKTAGQIAENAPLTLRSAKLILGQMHRSPAERDVESAAQSILDCYASEDYAEGVRAFLEKRSPRFKGR
ncbi:MAG TPA: enoyl-CoA hydratase [Myxococcales bacterium]|jgi:enoyl-CoA hydratase/carnithine racemase|nr:enoyl-CoA hydratase [Myxococcales bacterium]